MYFLKVSLISAVLLMSGCGYNDFQNLDEGVKAQASEVLNQYQRRADLIPNLVQVVKGYATHERETLEGVIQARSKATSLVMTPEMMNNPEALMKFQQAQGEISSFLSRLMMIQERYPDLKANTQFLELQSQIEGTENRITIARNRYIRSITEYNKTVRQFPTNLTAMFFGYEVRPQFSVENEKAVSTAPKVEF